MSGSSTEGATGTYGTLGVPAAANVPPGLAGAISWIDSAGNLWLFGGDGYASDGQEGLLNDLWEFNPTTKQWTWMSGSSKENPAGVYGTMGVPDAANIPGGRDLAVGWTDGNGNMWLLGGFGIDAAVTQGLLNDFWEFSPATKVWTWIGGSYLVGGQSIYGTLGMSAAANRPGGRSEAVRWTDNSGNFWLFGGYGYANYANETQGSLNDLWEFSPTTKEWTWISGSSTEGATGTYGTLGVPAAANVPPGLEGSVSWIDSSGSLWLGGGQFNALWKFSPTTKQWTWMSGSSTANATGVYGTLGVPAAANVPGARSYAVSWIDSGGNLWLFGGLGTDSSGAGGNLNDLWRYQP
jgi:N-acetylneuraminic acid mutarotase